METLPASDMLQGRIDFALQGVFPKLPKTYMCNVLAALKQAFEDRMKHLDNALTALHKDGSQVNLENSCLCQKEL